MDYLESKPFLLNFVGAVEAHDFAEGGVLSLT